MSKQASLQSARKRLQSYPKIFAACSPEASVYGKCVAQKYEDISPMACRDEFQAFKTCLKKAAQDMKTRL